MAIQLINKFSTPVMQAKKMFSNNPPQSPLTLSPDVIQEEEIDSSLIIEIYRNRFNIDVGKYFESLNKIQIFRCRKTNYRFYFPFDLEGDFDFYRSLQDFHWYYRTWKWEFEIASQFIASSSCVLEVGCGKGAFLEYLRDRGASCCGIELNQDAISIANDKGLHVLNETVQEHASKNREIYDVVCIFQVLEHVTDVKSFIQASVDSLKKGGTLIISVPNNDSFIRHDKEFVLNMPPHHTGLWDRQSLSNVQSLFDLELEKIYFEPLEADNCQWYYDVQLRRLIDVIGSSPCRTKIIRKLSQVVSPVLLRIINFARNMIRGHSILAVYTKM